MATKKTVKEEIAPEIQAEQLKDIQAEEAEAKTEAPKDIQAEEAEEQAEAPKDSWSRTVRMYVPKKPKGDDQQYYVCVNDRRFMIPANGKEQEMPLPVAEILKQAIADESDAEEFAANIQYDQA